MADDNLKEPRKLNDIECLDKDPSKDFQNRIENLCNVIRQLHCGKTEVSCVPNSRIIINVLRKEAFGIIEELEETI